MNIQKKKLTMWSTSATLFAAVALITAGCTGTGAVAPPTSTTAVTPKPAASIYCGSACQAQLQLKAAPASVKCKIGRAHV